MTLDVVAPAGADAGTAPAAMETEASQDGGSAGTGNDGEDSEDSTSEGSESPKIIMEVPSEPWASAGRVAGARDLGVGAGDGGAVAEVSRAPASLGEGP